MEKALEFSKEFWKSLETEDVDRLSTMIHDEARFVHMGVTLTKDQEFDTVKNRRIVYKHVLMQESSVTQIDSIFIVLNKMVLTAIVGGNEVVNPFVTTEVIIKQENVLKLASLSFTRINY